jgi:alcohol dehydrogenase class IV
MRSINLYYPNKLSVGTNCRMEFVTDASGMGLSRILVITFPEILPSLDLLFGELRQGGISLAIDDSICSEPGFTDFFRVFDQAQKHKPELVLGIGGGSVLDVAKLVAAQLGHNQTLEDITGINILEASFLPMPSCWMRKNSLKKG